MSFLLRKTEFITLSTCLRWYSISRQNHYDVLRLNKNCTDKEIKDAFFKLSKEYHPDKNKDPQAQELFVRIAEAYNILSKQSTRQQYDCTAASVYKQPSSYVYRTHVPYNLRKNSQYSYYYETNSTGTSQEQAQQEYTQQEPAQAQHAASTKRAPNYVIMLFCFGFAFVGLVVQMIVVRRSFFRTRRTVDEKSKTAGEELEMVRLNAIKNGNEMQTRLLLDKIVTAANPTVATASLGQALAGEKNHQTRSQFMKSFGFEKRKPDPNPSQTTGQTSEEATMATKETSTEETPTKETPTEETAT